MSRFKAAPGITPSPSRQLQASAATVEPRLPFTPAAPAPRVPSPRGIVFERFETPLHRFGFFMTAVYLFALFSMIGEIALHGFGFKPYISIISGPIAMIAVVLSGSIFRFKNSRIGLCYIGLMLWMVLCVPFAYWKGGSVAYLKDVFMKNYSIFFMLVALMTTLRHCRIMCQVLALSGALDLIFSYKYGGSMDGRFTMAFGTLFNPNDFATHLLVTAPFILFVLLDRGSAAIIRAAAGVTAVVMLFTILRTGSRGGFISLGCVLLLVLLRASAAQRVAIGLVSIVVLAVGFAVLPGNVLLRFNLLFNEDTSGTKTGESAVNSARARRQLLNRSIDMTLRNPIFGVGPGNFAPADAGIASELGTRATWQTTHNTYTEFSSENGIPSLILFVAVLVGSIVTTSRIYKRTRKSPALKQVSAMAFCLMLSLVGFSVNIMFSSMASRFYIPSLAGFAVALALAYENEIEGSRQVN